MVANQGKITTMGGTTGLVDQTDKMHTGLLKVLEAYGKGDICISHAGFTLTGAGTYTQYNLAQPIKFRTQGQYKTHTSNISITYDTTTTTAKPTAAQTQHPNYTRYDLVSMVPTDTPTLVITLGTLSGANGLVPDLPAGNIPIALIEVTAGTDPDKTDYNLQLYTLDLNTDVYLGTLKVDGDQTVGAGQDGHVLTYTHSNGKAALAAPASGLDIDGYSALGGTGLNQTQDHFVFSDNGTEKKISFSNLEDAIFGNVSGDATVAAGGGLTIAANAVEGSMLNSNTAGSGLDYGSNQLSVDVSDFMTNGSNNRIVTATGADAMNAEANATFDGSTLAITGAITATTTITGATTTGTTSLVTNGLLQQQPEALDVSTGVLAMTGTKSIVYAFDISGAGPPNQIELPNPTANPNAVFTIRNFGSNPITIVVAGGAPIDPNPNGSGGATHHALVSTQNQIDLPVGQHVTVHAVDDSVTPLQLGYYIIGN
tara:strand:- start:2057 stop:3508 length:1452 start_codon:yes stop_codon:yes gene_type:complete